MQTDCGQLQGTLRHYSLLLALRHPAKLLDLGRGLSLGVPVTCSTSRVSGMSQGILCNPVVLSCGHRFCMKCVSAASYFCQVLPSSNPAPPLPKP